jgi:hypothetical protein
VYYNGQKLDIQVRALIGFVEEVEMWWQIGRPISHQFKGVESDWSNIQTFTLNRSILPTSSVSQNTPPSNTSPANLNPSTPNKPNADNPNLFGFASWIGVVVVVLLSMVVVLLAVIAVVLWRKNVSQLNSTLNSGVVEG